MIQSPLLFQVPLLCHWCGFWISHCVSCHGLVGSTLFFVAQGRPRVDYHGDASEPSVQSRLRHPHHQPGCNKPESRRDAEFCAA